MLTIMTSMTVESKEGIKSLPKAVRAVPDDFSEIIKNSRYNKDNLSSLFFNTPIDAEAIRPTEKNPSSHCFSW